AGVNLDLGTLKVCIAEKYGHVSSKFDLLFDFVEVGDELRVHIEYNSDIYLKSSIERLADHLQKLMEAAIAHPEASINGLDYLNLEEKHRLLTEFNDTEVGYPCHETVINLLETQVEKTPHKTALVFEDKHLSYKELNERCNRLARSIQEKTAVEKGACVAVLLDRSEWSAISMISIMKLGCTYVPIDKVLPASRISYILAQSQSKVLITEKAASGELMDIPENLVLFELGAPSEDTDPSNLRLDIPQTASSYIIYTSGSTGKPKGVEQTHKMLYNLILWGIHGSKMNQGTKHLQFSSFSFDSSLYDIYYSLSSGGEVHIINEALRRDVWSLKDYILERGITTLSMPYAALKSMFGEISPEMLHGHRIEEIISTGEQLYITGGLRQFLQKNPSVTIQNIYGPSETHVVTGISYTYEGGAPEKASIGRPVHNTVIYILDSKMQLVPVGVEGEIYIGGWNLAKGYSGSPVLTAERFIEDPFRKDELVYRSGDIGKWLPDGTIEYIMRKDLQVKINGYRIELGEIESALRDNALIGEAVVLAKGSADADKILVAYLVSKTTLSTSDIRSRLKKLLPGYMIPGYFVQLEKMPLTPNGKVDTRALPDPEGLGTSTGVGYVAPHNEIEFGLVDIWSSILKIDREKIGIRDDFFALGGHSLRATRLASQIYKQFDVKFPLKDLFSSTVLEEQARLIGQEKKTSFARIAPAARQPHYPLSSSQRRLWVLSRFEQGNIAYNMSGAFELEGHLDKEAMEYAFSILIERHEILRTVFKEDNQGEIRQFIQSPEETGFRIMYLDLRPEQGNLEKRAAKINSLVTSAFNRPFDLSTGPLLRAELYQVSDDKWVLIYVMHHIISDGWSMGILIDELLLLYNIYSRGEVNPLPPLRIQYKDYAVWQQTQLEQGEMAEDKAWWIRQLEGELPVLELSGDRPRPAVKTYRGGTVRRRLTEELVSGIK
ncbi:MAG: amino acid adenylation domain-containing protein, partial [Bacteroidota bacterium]